MKKIILALVPIIFLINCSTYADLSGKCDREKKKIKECKIRNVLTCIFLYPQPERIKNSGLNICTNPDGIFLGILGDCDSKKSDSCEGYLF